MPDLPQHFPLTKLTASDLRSVEQWSTSLTQQLIREWTLLIQTVNALSRVGLTANKPATPDLDHIFYTESDGSQRTFVAVNGTWQQVGSTVTSTSSSGVAMLNVAEAPPDGEPGPPGPAGAAGAAGTTGSQGPTGPAVFLEAEQGEEGPIGPIGNIGPAGPQGLTGSQGPLGPAVFLEADIIEGELGPPGPQGAVGPTGLTGQTGSAGSIGPAVFLDADTGEEGAIGPPGPQGLTGAGGLTLTPFTQDLGTARYSGTFDITGLTGLTIDKPVAVIQTPAIIASKGNARDEFEMDRILLTGYVLNSTTVRAYWQAPSIVVGTYAFAFQVSG